MFKKIFNATDKNMSNVLVLELKPFSNTSQPYFPMYLYLNLNCFSILLDPSLDVYVVAGILAGSTKIFESVRFPFYEKS